MITRMRGAALAALCCAILTACSVLDQDDDRSRYRYTDIVRFGYVIANAFRATHPEFRLAQGDVAWGRPSDEMAIELQVEPNFGRVPGASVPLIFAIRQDGDSGRIYYTDPHDRIPVSFRKVLSPLGAQSPETNTLAEAIRRVGWRDAVTVPGKKAVDEKLKRAGRAKEVTAVVELKEPLTMSEIRSRKHLSRSNAIFSPAVAGGAPVYWDHRIDWFCQPCGGEGDQMTSDFRAWVSSLEPADEAVLNEFGLSLGRLREVARAGKVYGYIEHDANPVLLRKLLKEDYVSTMYLVQTREYCADDDFGKCVSGSWPKGDRLNG